MKDTLTIPASSSATESWSKLGLDLLGVRFPVMETGTAGVKLQATDDGFDVADADATWEDVYDNNGANLMINDPDETVAEWVKIEPSVWVSPPRWRLVACDSSGTAVTQTAERALTVLVRSLDAR